MELTALALYHGARLGHPGAANAAHAATEQIGGPALKQRISLLNESRKGAVTVACFLNYNFGDAAFENGHTRCAGLGPGTAGVFTPGGRAQLP